ncbi:hypothetical protein [Carnobacterium sp. TMP28]|uniref:hypothetical protein n=1 Tax=Carnobacterium sp. TMP28 TaxID=3397060 RepID=UPI0039E18DE4
MIFIAKPDYAEYEMVCEVTVVADCEKEAINIAERKDAEVNDFLLIDILQKSSVKPIEENFKCALSSSINW